MSRLVIAACAVVVVGCSSTQTREPVTPESEQSDGTDLAALVDMIAPDRERPEVDLAKIESQPLGSEGNPVRVNGPGGERAYLQRLRCTDGQGPAFNRLGSTGLSPFGYIMDIYEVACQGQPSVQVFMDMYHSKHREHRALSGFEIEPDGA